MLRKIIAVLLAGMMPVNAQAMETDTMLFTLNITIEGYEGNDPAVLGVITLKKMYPTIEEWTPTLSTEATSSHVRQRFLRREFSRNAFFKFDCNEWAKHGYDLQ